MISCPSTWFYFIYKRQSIFWVLQKHFLTVQDQHYFCHVSECSTFFVPWNNAIYYTSMDTISVRFNFYTTGRLHWNSMYELSVLKTISFQLAKIAQSVTRLTPDLEIVCLNLTGILKKRKSYTWQYQTKSAGITQNVGYKWVTKV